MELFHPMNQQRYDNSYKLSQYNAGSSDQNKKPVGRLLRWDMKYILNEICKENLSLAKRRVNLDEDTLTHVTVYENIRNPLKVLNRTEMHNNVASHRLWAQRQRLHYLPDADFLTDTLNET